MPPLSRYWFSYLLACLAIAALGGLGAFLLTARATLEPPVYVFFVGVLVATLSIFATLWSQWKTSKVQHTLAALQTLRTDREYLIHAGVAVQRKYCDDTQIFSAIDYLTKCGVGICGACASPDGRRICVDGPFISTEPPILRGSGQPGG